MMNLVGELVIAQTRLQPLEKAYYQRAGADGSVSEFDGLSDHLNLTITKLQENAMKVRMLPIAALLAGLMGFRAPRYWEAGK
ncbi:hypothetical protein [Paenibacillus nasutitermitis]|uniref:histidine kinase n=1 Tax=Paenibacillus nasutitermitis TaxID=1652958 RepID=A0A916Z3A6_9BACL|nr:hypothetical protein GCM10010911_34460 [Paenibacillus nasutitermitis]